MAHQLWGPLSDVPATIRTSSGQGALMGREVKRERILSALNMIGLQWAVKATASHKNVEVCLQTA